MMNVQRVLKELRAERDRTVREVEKIDAAISALGASRNGMRIGRRARPRLSAAARKKIALAQKARWARFRAQRKAAKKAA